MALDGGVPFFFSPGKLFFCRIEQSEPVAVNIISTAILGVGIVIQIAMMVAHFFREGTLFFF